LSYKKFQEIANLKDMQYPNGGTYDKSSFAVKFSKVVQAIQKDDLKSVYAVDVPSKHLFPDEIWYTMIIYLLGAVSSKY